MEVKNYFINPNDKENTKLYELIRQWVRDKFNLRETIEIKISEIKCTDPGCPDIDTYIYVYYEQGMRKYRIAKPLVYVRRWDIDGMREVAISN